MLDGGIFLCVCVYVCVYMCESKESLYICCCCIWSYIFLDFRSASFSALASLLIFIRSGILPLLALFFFSLHHRSILCIQYVCTSRLWTLHRVVFFTGFLFCVLFRHSYSFLFKFLNFLLHFVEKKKWKVCHYFSSATVSLLLELMVTVIQPYCKMNQSFSFYSSVYCQ